MPRARVAQKKMSFIHPYTIKFSFLFKYRYRIGAHFSTGCFQFNTDNSLSQIRMIENQTMRSRVNQLFELELPLMESIIQSNRQ